MGLFSRKSNSAPKSDIPTDILEDVSVNGEGRKHQNEPAHIDPTAPAKTASPFLSTPAETPVAPVMPSGGNVIDTVAGQPEISIKTEVAPEKITEETLTPLPVQPEPKKEENPKPFSFSDQTPLPAEIHFSEPPIRLKKEVTPENSAPDFSNITQDKALLERHMEHLAPRKPEPEPVKEKSSGLSGKLVYIGVFVLILALILGGSWYYFNTRSAQEAAVVDSIDELDQIVKEEQVLQVGKPNYLTLDVETATLDQIKELLNAELQKMSQAGIVEPIEYLVVDANKNQVAFSRFALLVGADQPKDLVNASQESFSLYIYHDQGAPRMAIAVNLKPEAAVDPKTGAGMLLATMTKLFYVEPYSSSLGQNITFRTGDYNGNAITYFNIDEAAALSFDTTKKESTLLMANSKDTLRKVLDKRSVGSE